MQKQSDEEMEKFTLKEFLINGKKHRQFKPIHSRETRNLMRVKLFEYVENFQPKKATPKEVEVLLSIAQIIGI